MGVRGRVQLCSCLPDCCSTFSTFASTFSLLDFLYFEHWTKISPAFLSSCKGPSLDIIAFSIAWAFKLAVRFVAAVLLNVCSIGGRAGGPGVTK